MHRAPAHLKLLALVGFMLVVVATPRDWFAGVRRLPRWCIAVVVAISRVPPTYLLKRMVVELPFVVFALLLPFVATGPADRGARPVAQRVRAARRLGLLVKGTLGVLASLTAGRDHRAARPARRAASGCGCPHLLVQIMGFMVRYLDVVTDEMRRMRIARESRGFTRAQPRHWPVLARSAGALFIRSYERGERVHLAMLTPRLHRQDARDR